LGDASPFERRCKASIGVTRSVGYVENGLRVEDRDGKRVRDLPFPLDRDVWAQSRGDNTQFDGFAPSLLLLGITSVDEAPQA
jgi:hypothetical protein